MTHADRIACHEGRLVDFENRDRAPKEDIKALDKEEVPETEESLAGSKFQLDKGAQDDSEPNGAHLNRDWNGIRETF